MDLVHLLQRRHRRERLARLRAEVALEAKKTELLDSITRQRQALEFMQWRAENLDLEVARRIQAESLDQDRQELLEMIARHRPLGQVLDRLQTMVESHIPGSACAVIQAPPDPNQIPQLDESAEPNMKAAWGLQKLTGLQDPPHPMVMREWAKANHVREGWSIPILFGASPFLGILIVGYPHASEIPQQDLDLMELFARMAGMAINHRHLLDTLAHQARYDSLTSLPNRALFQDRLQQAIAQARRTGETVGLLFLDLDGFKHINDTLGHHVGDQLLVGVAQRLQALIRSSDTLARMGGDEFTIVMPNLQKEIQGASRVAQKCLQALATPFNLQGHELFIGTSIGISLFPQDASEPDQLQRNADAAMYQTKAKGKNGFTFFTPDMNERAQERLEMEGLLRKALDQQEFSLHFQPQFRLDGSLSGCEALVRWEHPRMGMISPGRFIPVAEENGLILPLGAWVLREACRCMAGWVRQGFQGLSIAVNVSSLQFEQDDFVIQVEAALASERLNPNQLELELTESLVMESPQQNARRLEALRGLGVRIAVDDFGTGYSSLSYLQRLPLDTLKIDQSFVRDIYPGSPDLVSSAPIVETIVGLARSLRLSLMAEGVETEAQREFLTGLACEGMQGFLLGRPMDSASFGSFLETLSQKRPD